MNEKIKGYMGQVPTVEDVTAGTETLWLNDRKCLESIQGKKGVPTEQVEDARKRLERFAPYPALVFPETAKDNEIVESELREIHAMKHELNENWDTGIEEWLSLRMDSHLPISGSMKARGGIYEVLKYAEELAMETGLLTEGDDYRKLAQPDIQEFFHRYAVQVGSTGNLGLGIGIMSAKLGFRVITHMSADAKQQEGDLLRNEGVTVMGYESDYCTAMEQGRKDSDSDPVSHFVDDENSVNLLLEYAVAGEQVRKQLEEKHTTIDAKHPLSVYPPCDIDGVPGGVAYGLKEVYGDHAHRFFMEPTQARCMSLGTAISKHDGVCVQDFGIGGKTDANGLAVGRPSTFVGKVVEKRSSGICTIEDKKLYDLMRNLLKTEDILIEPSVHATFVVSLQPDMSKEYARKEDFTDCMGRVTHIAQATGGSMMSEEMIKKYLETG